MNCLDEGRLRAYLDDELAPAEQDRVARHVAECAECARQLAALRETVALVNGTLAVRLPVTDAVEPAARAMLARFQTRVRAEERQPRHARSWLAGVHQLFGSRPRPVYTAVALLLVLGLAFVAPVQSLAEELFKTFRVQRFAAVTVPVPGLKGVPRPTAPNAAERTQLLNMLTPLGTPETNATQQSFREVPTLDEARAHLARNGGTLRALPADKAPASFAGATPHYVVSDPFWARYTLNVQVAKQYAQMANSPELAQLPWPNVDQLTLSLDVPAAVAIYYGDKGDKQRGFGIVQLASPTLKVPNEVDLNAFRTALLALPGLPPETVEQLKAIDNWEKTLIIPVPQDAVTKNVKINGEAGLLILDGQGQGGVVVWAVNGVLYCVGGTLPEADLLAIANSLR